MSMNEKLRQRYPVCARLMGPRKWQTLCLGLSDELPPDGFANILAKHLAPLDLPAYLPDLARLESLAFLAASTGSSTDFRTDQLCANPTLNLLNVGWQGLAAFFRQPEKSITPEAGEQIVLVYVCPKERQLRVRAALNSDLLALKIVVEELDRREVAEAGDTTLAALDAAFQQAIARGLLLKPASAIRRDPALFSTAADIPEEYRATQTFTLQWHITQACDLHCKHCYDRSSRSIPSLAEAIHALDQLYDFCQARHVYGQVSFTGGNPLLHPRFLDIYRETANRGLMTAILGNPTTPQMLEQIKTIQLPEFFQVSLEGLREHNDYIRGRGHFDRVLLFLDDLKAAGIYSMVMLTLTRDNINQVLSLAEVLRNRTDLFTFNRLSAVGQGAQLLTPLREEYEAFLRDYLAAQPDNPCMALKDNLINIQRTASGAAPFGGCAGFGCGAAFNFAALLSDGEVHACRKFPSPIGNLHHQTLAEIYDSKAADRYRNGPSECRGCSIRHVCGGCLAVISSQGLDISKDRDPCCFI